ncbi:hypothetical protein TM48_01700 [Mycobacterium shottsii]|nr:hypothetical protein TM48_01700 [Mycobacterium shottsii]
MRAGRTEQQPAGAAGAAGATGPAGPAVANHLGITTVAATAAGAGVPATTTGAAVPAVAV